MYTIERHFSPATLSEACGLLKEYPEARPVAGGTDLLVKLRHKPQEGSVFVDIKGIPELYGIRLNDDGDLEIGACETFTRIHDNELVQKYIPLLAEGAISMGGPQIRNVATIGGNICNGAVSADSAASVFALDAVLTLEGEGGKRIVPVREFYLGPGKVDRRQDEILTTITIPRKGREFEGSHYLKYSMRIAMDIATLGCACTCIIGGDGTIEDLRLAATVVAPTPVRLTACEKAGIGKEPTEETFRAIAELCEEDIKPRTSWRASKEFRTHILKTFVIRTGLKAAERSKELRG